MSDLDETSYRSLREQAESGATLAIGVHPDKFPLGVIRTYEEVVSKRLKVFLKAEYGFDVDKWVAEVWESYYKCPEEFRPEVDQEIDDLVTKFVKLNLEGELVEEKYLYREQIVRGQQWISLTIQAINIVGENAELVEHLLREMDKKPALKSAANALKYLAAIVIKHKKECTKTLAEALGG